MGYLLGLMFDIKKLRYSTQECIRALYCYIHQLSVHRDRIYCTHWLQEIEIHSCQLAGSANRYSCDILYFSFKEVDVCV